MSTEPSGLRVAPPEGPSVGGDPEPTVANEPTPAQRRARRTGEIAEAGGRRATTAPAPPERSRAGARKAPPRKKRKARMVHRVVRHVEVWSVAKVMAVFALCGYLIGMISGYLLWRAADRVGTIDGIEGFMEDSGSYESFEILGDVVFKAAAIGGAVLAALFVALGVLGAILFNLISDLTGGVRFTAIDEDLIVTPARRPPTEGTAEAARRPPTEGTADAARRPEAEAARRPSTDARREPGTTPPNGTRAAAATPPATAPQPAASERSTG